jgi:hypothetical protein
MTNGASRSTPGSREVGDLARKIPDKRELFTLHIFSRLLGRAHVNTLEAIEHGDLKKFDAMAETAVYAADILVAKLREIKPPPARGSSDEAPHRMATALVPPVEHRKVPEPDR